MARAAKQFDPEHRIEGPHGWIQWKGTRVCADLHCGCGALLHLDDEFAYYVKCPECGGIYECSGFFKLIPADTSKWDDADFGSVKNPCPTSD